MSALKMKLKNIKAQSKRTKLEFVDTEVTQGSDGNEPNQFEENPDGDGSGTDLKFIINGKRKRCKKFSQAECDLLIEL